MVRLTISISEEDSEYIESKVGDGGEYESKSAFIRNCIRRSQRTEKLESEVERLQRKLTAANKHQKEIGELAEFAEEEKQLRNSQRKKSNAPIWKRLRWLIFGYEGE